MKIYRNLEHEVKYMNKLREYLDSSPREGVHVSDLINPRKAFFKRVSPLPLTDREVGYFITGRVLHLIVQTALGIKEERRVYFAEPHKVTVEGNEDLQVGTLEGDPGEFKTTRKWSIPSVPDQQYLDQEGMYCAMENALDPARGLRGHIWVLYLTPGRKFDGSKITYPQFVFWTVEYAPEDLEAIRQNMRYRRDAFVQALATKTEEDFKKMPLCYDWLCATTGKSGTEIQCPHFDTCKPEGRWIGPGQFKGGKK